MKKKLEIQPIPHKAERLLNEVEDRYPRAVMKMRSAWECPELAEIIFNELFTYDSKRENREGFAPEAFMKLCEVQDLFFTTYGFDPHKENHSKK